MFASRYNSKFNDIFYKFCVYSSDVNHSVTIFFLKILYFCNITIFNNYKNVPFTFFVSSGALALCRPYRHNQAINYNYFGSQERNGAILNFLLAARVSWPLFFSVVVVGTIRSFVSFCIAWA